MSKITKVEIHEYTYDIFDLDHHRTYSPGAKLTLPNFGLRITTDDGLSGEYCPLHAGKRAFTGQVMMLAPLLIGRNPFERTEIFDDLKRALRQLGFLGVGAIDIALWDLAGKAYGRSITELLGGFRKTLPTYASTIHGDRVGGLSSPEKFVEFAEECHEMGYQAFKVHGWSDGNAREEARNVEHLADHVGDRMTLMLDPACELRTFADTLYVGRACDNGKYFWYEDPMRDAGTSMHAHRKLRQMIKTPILQGEHVRGIEPKADWMATESTDFIRADPDLDMGITGTMRIAHTAESFGLDVEIHACGPAHRICMSAIRNSNYYELALVGPKTKNPIPPIFTCGYNDQLDGVAKDGTFPVPTRPGLGVSYDWDFIASRKTATHIYE